VIAGSSRAALRWFAILSVSFFVLFLFLGITIAAVTVLAIHKRLRPSVSTDCNYSLLHNNSKGSFPDPYPIGLLQTRDKPAFPFEVILDCRSARAEDGTTMFVILWEFEVKPGCQERFERVYGPQGDWVRLFLRDPRFRGSQLLRDPSRTHFYFTLDFWDSESAYQDFQNAHRASYEALDRATETFSLRERCIASFTISR
jgi:heme-degrading monooxygenase HmoA